MVVDLDEPPELAEEAGVDRLLPPLIEGGREGGPRRRGGTLEQLAYERLQADVERREVGGLQALALCDPLVEERRDGLGERAATPALLGRLEHGQHGLARHHCERA